MSLDFYLDVAVLGDGAVPSEVVVVAAAYRLLVAQIPEEHFQALAMLQEPGGQHDGAVAGQKPLAVVGLSVAAAPGEVVVDRRSADWPQLLMAAVRKSLAEAALQPAGEQEWGSALSVPRSVRNWGSPVV